HVYNVLLEKNLLQDRGWIEFSVSPLFSPQSLIAEGTANFGREVVFTKSGAVSIRKTSDLAGRGDRPLTRRGILRRSGSSQEAESRHERSRPEVRGWRYRYERGRDLVARKRAHG